MQKGFNPKAVSTFCGYLTDMEKNGTAPDRAQVSSILETIVETADMTESDSTFFPVLAHILNQRPSIVIFENVEGAPWEDTTKYFLPGIGYSAGVLPCDTKDYYLPQTRRRKYLVAFDNDILGKEKTSLMAKSAMKFLDLLKRRASVDVEKFLYNNMDKAAQLDLQQMEFETIARSTKDSSWAFSHQRHQNSRRIENLGQTRPFSGLQATGDTLVYDRTNKMIFNRMPDRIKDITDIHLLRGLLAEVPFDVRFKVKITDCSQNVDRDLGNSPFGISGCLTPNGMSFLSSQCRWITGREYFLLQGLPMNTINLSRESHDQLKNLAGNAMTTTVVASAFLSAIMAIPQDDLRKFFPKIDDKNSTYTGLRSNLPLPRLFSSSLHTIPGFDLGSFEEATAGTILDLAARLRAYCYCTGTAMYSSAILFKCVVCGTIRCNSCKGNPKHEYEKMELVPEAYGQEAAMLLLMKHFPRTFQGLFTEAVSRRLTAQFDDFLEAEGLAPGTHSVASALSKAVFYFDCVHLSETISVCYTVDSGFTLKIMIDTDSVSWYLFLDAHSRLGNSFPVENTEKPEVHKKCRRIRKISTSLDDTKTEGTQMGMRLRDFCMRARPFARAKVADRSLASLPSESQWQAWNFNQPHRIQGGKKVFNVRVSVSKHEDDSITINSMYDDNYTADATTQQTLKSVIGTWMSKPDCDAAEGSLYVRNIEGGKKLFLFKDPSRTGSAKLDSFVISENPRLVQWYDHREIMVTFVALKDPPSQLHKLKVGTHVQKVAMDGYWDTLRV